MTAGLYRFSTGLARRVGKPLSLQVLSSYPDICLYSQRRTPPWPARIDSAYLTSHEKAEPAHEIRARVAFTADLPNGVLEVPDSTEASLPPRNPLPALT